MSADEVRALTPEQFFDLFQRGVLDVSGGGGGGGGGGGQQREQRRLHALERQQALGLGGARRSALGPMDGSVDLLSTVEDSARARRSDEVRAGYGTAGREADDGVVLDAEDEAVLLRLMASSGTTSAAAAGGAPAGGAPAGAREREERVGAAGAHRLAEVEAQRRRQRESAKVVGLVNDHSARVVGSVEGRDTAGTVLIDEGAGMGAGDGDGAQAARLVMSGEGGGQPEAPLCFAADHREAHRAAALVGDVHGFETGHVVKENAGEMR